MNFRWLKIFQKVAQEENMSYAGEMLHISQPAVSQSIRDLEEYIGTPLFDRIAGRIILNNVGKAFLIHTNKILDTVTDMELNIPTLAENTVLSIGSSITLATVLLPNILTKFKALYPQIKVKVVVENAKSLTHRLIDGSLELCFLEGFVTNPLLAIIPLNPFACSYICSKSSEYAEKVISVESLQTLPFLLREKGSAIRDAFDFALLNKNIKMLPQWTSVNSGVLLKAVEANLGVSLLPDFLISDYPYKENLRTFQVQETPVTCGCQIALHSAKSQTKPLEVLIQLAKKASDAYLYTNGPSTLNAPHKRQKVEKQS